jgi:predicted DNA-binding transcriptional regulator AlpA
MEPVVRVKDVARILCVSEGTVYRLVARADLPRPTKTQRGSWTWPWESIEASLNRLAWRYRGDPAPISVTEVQSVASVNGAASLIRWTIVTSGTKTGRGGNVRFWPETANWP